MTKKTTLLVVSFLAIILCSSLAARNIRVLCPYFGTLKNTYEDSEQGMDMDDNGLLGGVFFQWVNPERYQWNVFFYQSSEINYSTILGGHLIFDLYLGVSEYGKNVVGIGTEYIRVDMDAGADIKPLEDFQLTNNIVIPYLRSGYSLDLKMGMVNLTVFPWGGAQYERITGDMSFTMDPPGPAPPTETEDEIEDDDWFGMLGLSLRAKVHHFLEVDFKPRATFNSKETQYNVASLVNFYFTEHWGVSYRFKYMEYSGGSNMYNLFGVAYVF